MKKKQLKKLVRYYKTLNELNRKRIDFLTRKEMNEPFSVLALLLQIKHYERMIFKIQNPDL